MSLSEIIEALEKAPQGSRELDWRVAEYLEQIPAHRIIPVGWDYGWYRGSETDYSLWRAKDSEGRSVELWQAPQVTTSIDAALTLVPGAEIELTNLYDVARATIHTGSDYGPFYGSHECNSLPIALCIASLKALQARGDA